MNREELVIKIQALLSSNVKPDIAIEFYEYFCSNIKPEIASKSDYSVVTNTSNNTLTLYLNSDAIPVHHLAVLFEILNQHKNI